MKNKILSLEDLKSISTDTIRVLEKIIKGPAKDNQKIQASYGLSRIITGYVRLTEVSDLEKRLEKLEQMLKDEKTNRNS